MIIGLAGAKHAGKNTVANYIAKEFGDRYEIKEWSFAEDLKIGALATLTGKVYPAKEAIQYADTLKEECVIKVFNTKWDKSLADVPVQEFSGREFLQWYGTEAHRSVFGDNFWVDNLLQKILADEGGSNETFKRLDLITDTRFPNEAEAIHEWYGKVVRVSRPDVEKAGDTHASERPLPDDLVDVTIRNHGSLEELKIDTSKVLRHILSNEHGKRVPYA